MLAYKYQFDAIGVPWSIETDVPLKVETRSLIGQTIESFDQTYSRFRSDSLVRQMHDQPHGLYTFPDSITTLYETYQRLDRVTSGRINPLVGRSLEQLGYDENYSFQVGKPVSAPSFTALKLDGLSLSVSEPALLDVGAIGKGLLIDVLSDIIEQHYKEYVVDGSGDVRVRTNLPEKIGLEHPSDPSKVVGVVTILRGSICGSAKNRRRWGDGIHHIIDATTGQPANTTVLATWAIADSAMIADGLASALFFVDYPVLEREFGSFTFARLTSTGEVEHNMPQGILLS